MSVLNSCIDAGAEARPSHGSTLSYGLSPWTGTVSESRVV